MSISKPLKVVVMAALAGACASRGIPRERLASSQGSIRAAEEMGANDVPQASLYLQFAREQAEEAQELYKRGDDERATQLLMRAEADAKLSLAITRAEPLKAEAADAEKKLQAYQASHP